jgi:Mrp family chromosome partitioning ATPase
VPNLSILSSGPAVENPWALFRSNHLADLSQMLRQSADYVLYDTPSTLVFTDAINLCPVVDAAFLCVRAMEPASGSEQRVIDILNREQVAVLGNVISDIPAPVLDSYNSYLRYYPGATSQSMEIEAASPRAIGSGVPTDRWIQSRQPEQVIRLDDERPVA